MNYGEPETRQRAPSNPHEQQGGQSAPGFGSNLHAQLGHMVWEAGSKQIKDSFNSYGRIDYFRPYFDVEPKQVRNRLFQSFLPRKPSTISVSNDLYGPSMVVLTMVALLLLNMKSSGYTTQDGTLIGSAMVSCFAAWIILSTVISTLCYIVNIDVGFVNTISLVGYSMTSHCLVLLLTAIYHPSHDHLYFFFLLIVFCFPSALRTGLFLGSKTRDPTHKMTVLSVCIGVHLLYLIYLHFGFHVMVEELDEILGESPPNVIKSAIPLDNISTINN
ncbi:unnamed protein product, partial [Mesorhabditis belari]|uniref:Protein YIPF n=1 Tax=Mesorhabditis belari TaxID=2138241 RepID=A0AAF3EM20_9BILA